MANAIGSIPQIGTTGAGQIFGPEDPLSGLDLQAGQAAAPSLATPALAGLQAGGAGQTVVGQTALAAGGGAVAAGPVGAAVAGGLALVGGLLGARARKKREERERRERALQTGLETQRRAAQAGVTGTQSGIQQILGGLSRALG